MNNRFRKPLWLPVCLALGLSAISPGDGQESARPVKVVIKDGKMLAGS